MFQLRNQGVRLSSIQQTWRRKGVKLGVKLSCTSELPYKCAIERTICQISFKGL